MAQILTIKLMRNDSSCPWGFRLQGGKDFGSPLLIQKVSLGSLAERAGLQVGDAVLQVNNMEVADQRHKDAQDAIVRAGNSFEITVQRGGFATWRPHVSPIGTVPSPNPYQSISPTPVTRTSLVASNRQSPLSRPPCGFNSPSKPFAHSQLNGSHESDSSPIKAIVNKQYNSPVGIYSDESIAETLSAQAEVLAGGVLGVNFKKNEKNYDGQSSEVFKMVREAEKESKSPEPDNTQNGVVTPSVAGLRHVSAPQTKSPNSESSSLTPGKNICADCERLIVGVFVRIKDKNLHVECFKCATCGTSLKNVGYYSINNKLYCDIHAKMIAKQNPPTQNMESVTVSSPSQYTNAKTFSPVSMNNTPPSFAQNSCRTASSFHNSSNVNGTDAITSNHFSNVSVKKSETDFTSNTSISTINTSFSQCISTQQRLPFLKPRTEKLSAFTPVIRNSSSSYITLDSTESFNICNNDDKSNNKSETTKLETLSENNKDTDESKFNLENLNIEKRQSVNSEEIREVLLQGSNDVPESLNRPVSPVASELEDEFSSIEISDQINRDYKIQFPSRPHSVRSLSPYERPLTPTQIVVFPPEVPSCFRKREKSSTEEVSSLVKTSNVTYSETPTFNKCCTEESEKIIEERLEVCDENITSINETNTCEIHENVSLENLPSPKYKSGNIASAMTVAPDRPFTPVELTKAFITLESVDLPNETKPYFYSNEEKTQMISSEESITKSDKQRPSLSEALSIAPKKSYNISSNNSEKLSNIEAKKSENCDVPSLSFDPSIILKKEIPKKSATEKKESEQFKTFVKYDGRNFFPPITDELKAKFEHKLRTGSFSEKQNRKSFIPTKKEERSSNLAETRVSKTPPIVKCHQFTSTGLHKPLDLPHYQQCVREMTNRNKTPTLSRRNTPTNFGRSSLKTTPTNFEATVCTQQKTFHSTFSSFENKLQVSEIAVYTEKKNSNNQVMCINQFSSAEDAKSSQTQKTSAESQSKEVNEQVEFKPIVQSTVPKIDPIISTSLPSSALSLPLSKSSVSSRLTKTLAALTSKCHASNTSKNLSCVTLKTVTSSDPNPVGARGSGISNSGVSAGFSAPRRGKGVWNPQNLAPGARIPLCAHCNAQIRGPFITALGKIWCPEHFICVNQKCKRSLLDIGFVEEPTGLYCEYCFEQYLAPTCAKCGIKVKGDCLNAIGKHFHPECFTCSYCGKLFGNNPFFLEDGLPYCENDWNELFTTKCFACGFPIEAGDRWVEALNNNYHSPCFNCTMCKANLEGQSFYAKGGRPYCKKHSH